MNLRNYILGLLILTISIELQAQQIPMYSQYVINNYMLNPAVAGSKKCQDFKVGYRTQSALLAPLLALLGPLGRLRLLAGAIDTVAHTAPKALMRGKNRAVLISFLREEPH